MWLTDEQLAELTRRKHRAAQIRVLKADRITFELHGEEIKIDVDTFRKWVTGPDRYRYEPAELYRVYDSKNTLLYVGISISSIQRAAGHKSAIWWMDAARIEIERFSTRLKAIQAEAEAIKTENPVYNIVHSTRRENAPKRR